MISQPKSSSPVRQSALVVVGAGMSTHAFLRRLEQNGHLRRCDVTVVGEEPRPPYDRVNLTDSFSGRSPDDLLLAPSEWYAEHGVNLVTGDQVVELDRSNHAVRTSSGSVLPYDQLVLATGSKPFVPPIQGTDLPGVFVYRTIDDIEQIRQQAAQCSTAAVLGGGLLGLEAGKALCDLNLETHILEVAPSLMPRQLNSEAGALLKEEVEKLGVSVHLLRQAAGIRSEAGSLVIDFARDETLNVDMVVISAGIRPRDELASSAGLPLGERGGIAIDAHLRTADPRVYAIGECVSLEGSLFGLVGPCYDMAHVLADNLASDASTSSRLEEFEAVSQASRLKLMGVDVSTLGTTIGEADAASVLVHNSDGICRTLLMEKNRVIGAIGVGPWPERERLSGLIAGRKKLSARRQRRFLDEGDIWADSEGESILDWPAGATVCSCLNVTRGELTDAMLGGAKDADQLAEATGASTVCGSCRDLVCELAGQPQDAVGGRRMVGLLTASCAGVVLVPLFFVLGPFAFADSVQSSWRQIDFLWQDSFAKQVTGFTLLGISVAGLLLSLRKRISWFKLGEYGFWRSLHGMLGLMTLIGFLVHTGLRMGHNFTFALAIVFLVLNLLGAFTGVTAALESRFTGPWARTLRAWRPRLTQWHIWLFWPLPALVLFHIISVYYY
ncbi:MAG: FAD-dependent oxidoreductase [Planctomycetota bacterium]